MKSLSRCVRFGGVPFVVMCLFAKVNPLHAQWEQLPVPVVSVNSFANVGPSLLAGSSNGVLLSTDNGASWNVGTGMSTPTTWALARIGANLFAGTQGGVYLSTNSGATWSLASSGLPPGDVGSFGVIGTDLYAGVYGNVYLSGNNGTTWTATGTGVLPPAFVYSLTPAPDGSGGTNLFAATDNWVYRYTAGNWTATGGSTASLRAIVATPDGVGGAKLFVGAVVLGGVWLSTNNGTTWSQVNTGLTYTNVRALAVDGTRVFAGTTGGVFLTANNGSSWTNVSEGLADSTVHGLSVIGSYLYAGTSMGAWRRQLSQMVTSAGDFTSDLPGNFTLGQNYPNPFNPSTTISFRLPYRSLVSLNVVDVLGREVSVLLAEELSAGTYSREWSVADIAGGVYFYRLQAADFSAVRKMMVVK